MLSVHSFYVVFHSLMLSVHSFYVVCPFIDVVCPFLDVVCPFLDVVCPFLDVVCPVLSLSISLSVASLCALENDLLGQWTS